MTTTSHYDKAVQSAEILVALGKNWFNTSDPDNQTRTLTHGNGYGVRLHWDDHQTPARIEISGLWPKTQDGSEQWPSQYDGGRPSITVASTRTPKAIAQAILTRFLPVYLPVYTKMVAQAKGHDDYAAQTAETTAKLLALPGVTTGHHGSALYMKGYYPYSLSPQGKSVRFEAFSVPADVAVKILAMMREAKPEERDSRYNDDKRFADDGGDSE